MKQNLFNHLQTKKQSIVMEQTTAKKTITTLSVIAKEWFDNRAGNSYYAARINVNNELIQIPFTYGYESAYIQGANQSLLNAGYECGTGWNISKYCNENNIPAIFQLIERCTQKEVKEWGE